MRLGKRIVRDRRVRAIACWIAAQYVRLVWHTGRWSVENTAAMDALIEDGKTFVVCYWHGRLLMLPYAWPYKTPMNLLISKHADGLLISMVTAHFGLKTIAGSSSKGGGAALRAMVRALNNGECVGITPDGPRGPRMRATAGAVHTARMAGVPLVPMTYAASRRGLFGGWDRFVVPAPFCRGVIRTGAPIDVPRGLDDAGVERIRAEVEGILNDMTHELDSRFGWPPIAQGPIAAAGGAASGHTVASTLSPAEKQ